MRTDIVGAQSYTQPMERGINGHFSSFVRDRVFPDSQAHFLRNR